jgi:hypothetical protein
MFTLSTRINTTRLLQTARRHFPEHHAGTIKKDNEYIKVLNESSIDSSIKNCEYAVRGAIP